MQLLPQQPRAARAKGGGGRARGDVGGVRGADQGTPCRDTAQDSRGEVKRLCFVLFLFIQLWSCLVVFGLGAVAVAARRRDCRLP